MQGHRIEGADKVRGLAKYTDDLRFATPPLIALTATSPVARGRVQIDTSAALALPGTRCVIDHTNAPRLKRAILISMCEPGTRMPLQSDQVEYAGQPVAIVVADSLHAARDALAALIVTIENHDAPAVVLSDAENRLKSVRRAGIGPGAMKKGDADAALADASVSAEVNAHAAPHHQNPMEPGAVVARWDPDGGVTVHAAVQWHHLDASMIGQAFGLSWADGMTGLLGRAVLGTSGKSKVRLHNQLSGGAFGRNISYLALLLAPIAAKVAGGPVKLVQSRRDTFSLMSHRSEVKQRLRVGADTDGKLKAIVLEPDIARGNAAFVEPIGEMPMQLYAHDTHRLTTRVAKLDLPGAGWMRGPGVAHAIFALEQAMDDLARQVGKDPLDIRLANYSEKNPANGKSWEAKALLEAYEVGAAKFGWRDRPKGGSVRPDGRVSGFGMASAIDLGRQFPAHATVTMTKDGRVVVSLAVSEMGQGLLTGLTGVVAEMTGVSPDRVEFKREATKEGYAAGSIGSTGTYSNAAAVKTAVEKIIKKLAKAGGLPKSSKLQDGMLVAPNGESAAISDLLSRTGDLTAKGRAGLTFGASKQAKASFGAVFCEMAVDPITLDVEVIRLVGAYDCGRVLQPKIARAQLIGAMIMGMGQALMEETRLDRKRGHWTNAEIGEALVPTQADCPHVEAHFVGDTQGKPGALDFKGIAETAIVGVSPAIASAFADATGGVVHHLPLNHAARLAAVSRAQFSFKEAAE
ncbi:xanthine dehydrogenase family protein molybdopterin-binding subunit [Pseudaestuariivita rosea]|uniref:xanthine dehydrogenase family protein molybdopterin-binding subunit n=1 Tax=Pseudaestuariivita rosea TaxID=2763263 RepID=UPI001ABB1CAF|nr:xanthine dehydrogenase family protein molybdopterin-binding subunit [Pseudaestuariivita rosea]